MMSVGEVKESLKRIINQSNGIKSNVWDSNMAQNVGYIIKTLEEQIESQRVLIQQLKSGIDVNITGVKPKQIIADDHWE